MDELNPKEEVDKKLQVALTLSIFFPSFLSTFYDARGVSKELLNKVNLSWSILVVFFLVDYIVFSMTKRTELSAWVYSAINSVLLIAISSFIFPIYILATTLPNKPLSFLNNLAGSISLYGLPAAPTAIALLFTIGLIDFVVRDLRKTWKESHLVKRSPRK